MYQLEPDQTTGVISLTATGSTPVELIQTALQGLLEALRGETPTGSDESTSAVPFRGQGTGLEPLFLDLAEDMISQVEEFGAGLDEVRIDGLLRTDTGGFTAWGYLSGDPGRRGAAPRPLRLTEPVIVENGDKLHLTCELFPEAR